MSLTVAIVGCGKIADGHIEEIQKLPHLARVVAVCDLEILMAEQAAFRFQIPKFYDSMDRMLDEEKPDVVHVTTPPQSHLALAKKAIDAGCHVYVEKPLTLNSDDTAALLTYAQKMQRQLTTGYTYLFDPPAVRMREMIQNGVAGEVLHVESFFGYDLSGGFGKALMGDSSHWVHRLPGKLFHNNIDHLLNKAAEFVADDNPEVKTFGYSLRPECFGDSRDEMLDELRVMIHGGKTSVYSTFSSHIRPAGHFTRIYGTKNSLHVDYVARTVTVDASPTLPSAIGRLMPAFKQGKQYLCEGARNVRRFAKSDFHFFAGLNALITRYYESIINKQRPPIPHRDILWVSRVMDQIFMQIEKGYSCTSSSPDRTASLAQRW